MEETVVTIKFDGQSHKVDVQTFTSVLINYATVVQAAADEAGVLDPVKVCITATEPGSLDAVISVLSQAAEGAFEFAADNQIGIIAAVSIASALYEFKRKIAGKKSVRSDGEDGDNVVINADGDVIILEKPVFNLYRDHPETTEAIDRSFSALDENPEITGVEMSSQGKTMFRAERDEFSSIACSPNFENENVRHTYAEANLTVVKPFLAVSKTRKWEFIYNGEKITAPIVDEAFLNSLNKVPFRMGTMMRVKLDVVQEYDENVKAYLNKKFSVVEVIEISDPPEPEPLF